MRIVNRFIKSYKPLEKIEAGIVLLGSEVKALRASHADITGAYVRISGSEANLINAKIFPYEFSRIEGYQEDRTRKLLLHKKEILALKSKLDQGKFTIVPLSIYLKDGNFKLELALVESKNKREKRRDKRREAIEREQERELKTIL
ncbi:MAG: SsrA-binding protein [Candidatus Levybacteria bacterium RIFCSPHIGHO2_02_FULL_40_18]|nr:MAG: SsrA-binding protein [Candidatus Levybacteria bacterium RIFCSPHIGHO2_01_FULL_40_58]OGH26234.1 MAG: SsrA-binding protein [Candidatus Levybacteria bacterium RIFCSPHIGHO2_02_FULL_40_18]OGH31486.1 MAG: SsrA-binding protein [Candidatus Levybacteria bacterium RIFCSPHIGHO2_12_FULL_40_31]OGH40126.1 MAG: SsrA-binding protein [Candidatus Levybacteria bacterium RIFCSPLOWO2_01_FULL_40_64]OGH49079.1 MAG: SsrA-binding protein [Candidatus Levybacteria bacterium RIFCSPLOWO2_02_FULL_41_11]OGH53747.1 MA